MSEQKSESGGLNLPSAEVLAKLPPDGGPQWNRLVFESSPYLLQHAANPVDWYPWGEEAFEKARSEDKAVFLSIGYATCHWCHVMAHESFEDDGIAQLLNKHFVCIKVDKEERPDIDDIYMTACQATTGHGGWPLTVMLTHDRKPFFAGTYFARQARGGRIGMAELVPRLGELWGQNRQQLLQDADQLTKYLRETSSAKPGGALGAATVVEAVRHLQGRFDRDLGGFSGAPKFPTPHNFLLLLRHWRRTGEQEALAIVEHSLLSMRRGGIFDHVGFGFHRYSTDSQWLLPHFEKMLYDQALMAMACLETFQATGGEAFAAMAREIFTYVLRDMTSPEGGFYSAEDADSEGEEGKFYFWRPQQVIEVLGETEGRLFCEVFQILPGGNFRDEASGRQTGENIPHQTQPLEQVAQTLQIKLPDLKERLEKARSLLFESRQGRIHPLKDDKILTDWNGLMIAALAMGGRILGDPAYLDAATRAADFVLDHLCEKGRLLKRYRRGRAGLPGLLDDYAFTIWGLFELYQAGLQTRYLAAAVALTEEAIASFCDPHTGAFFLSPSAGEALILRSQKIYDGATPSGNSVMAWNLARLGRLLANSSFEERAWGIVTAFAGEVGNYPAMSNLLMCALDFLVGPTQELVIASIPDAEPEWERELARALSQRYLPHLVRLRVVPGVDTPGVETPPDAGILKLAPYLHDFRPQNGRPTAFVCRNHSCQTPTNDIGETLTALQSPA